MKKSTTTTTTNNTTSTKQDKFCATFADAVRVWYARNTAAGMPARERAEALHGGDNALAYRVAAYAARRACAAFVLASATDAPQDAKERRAAADAVRRTRDAFYAALRDVYAFSGVRVDALDAVKLPALFAVRMDAPRRVHVGADVVTAEGAAVETYERRRVVSVPTDAVWLAALDAQAGRKLAGVDVVERARDVYADIKERPTTAAKDAPRAKEGKAPVHAVEPKAPVETSPRPVQSPAVENAKTGEEVMSARREEMDAEDAARIARNESAPGREVKKSRPVKKPRPAKKSA